MSTFFFLASILCLIATPFVGWLMLIPAVILMFQSYCEWIGDRLAEFPDMDD